MPPNRRRFLGASVGAGLLAVSRYRPDFVRGADIPALMTNAEIPTPALLLDQNRFEINLKRMADFCQQANCQFRPHAKTHKCPQIAKRQLDLGAAGICVATVPEAEAMAAAGIGEILLTSPVAELPKIERMARLAKQGAQIMLAVGNVHQMNLLAQAARQHELKWDVLIDVDTGDRRTGIEPGQPAVELAKRAAQSGVLHIKGVQGYSGQSAHVAGFDERKKHSLEAVTRAIDTKQLLIKAGLDAPICSGGSTGTYNIDGKLSGVTELQPGSYVFMDVEYQQIGGQNNKAIYDDFLPSLTVLTTVVSATYSDRVTVDAGIKALDTTTPFAPVPLNAKHLNYMRGGDEFGFLTSESGPLPKLGERMELIVPHCDPTVSLHDRMYVVKDERVVDIWPIVARREVGPTIGR